MKKRIFLFILFVIFLQVFPIGILASEDVTLKKRYVDNVYYTRRGGGKPYESLQYETYEMNGKVAYCIEPGIAITTTNYQSFEGLINSPYSEKINNKLELIGFYGYDYPDHQTLRYRMATQALIWEVVSGQIIEFWTERYGYGNYIDLTKEKNNIMKLVNNYNNKPNFDNDVFKISVNEELELIDNNNLLREYEVVSNDNLICEIKENSLLVKVLDEGEFILTLKRKSYDNETTFIYFGKNKSSQKMAYFRISNPSILKISIKAYYGSITLNKLDYDTKSNISSSLYLSLENATYGIYDLNNNLIEEIKTNSLGNAKSNSNLKYGNYYLKEISPSMGYMLDEEKHYFEINIDNLHPSLTVYEKIIKSEIIINKFKQDKYTNSLDPEKDIEFYIYDEFGNYVTSIKTNELGISKIELSYGLYKFCQQNSSLGYLKVDDFYVNVDSEKENIFNLIDLPLTRKVKIIKKDYESHKNIFSTEVVFKIINLDLNEEVCYLDNDKKICEYKTDSNGELVLPIELVSGKYELKEIKAPDGYSLNKESMFFEINENNEVVNDQVLENYYLIEFFNKPIKGQINIIKKGEELVIDNNTYYYKENVLNDVSFSLYAYEDIKSLDGTIHYKKGELIETLNTKNNGTLSFNNLYLGKYLIKETNTLNNYILDNKEYIIELNPKELNHDLYIKNYLKKSNLIIIKKDSLTNEIIPNTKIGLYNINNKCLYIGKTNELGQIIINDLVLGKYYLKELESALGYYLNDEDVFFELNDFENKEIVLLNEKIIINVPNTLKNKSYLKELVSILLIISGLGVLLYGIISKKKI